MAKKKKAPRRVLPLAIILVGLFLMFFGLHYFNRDSTPNLPKPPLKYLASKHGIELGNFAIAKRLDEKPYSDILTSQFDLALVDNVGNWHFTDADLRTSPTTYNFSHIDQVVDFAHSHNMPLQFHHLLWGEEKWLPEWLKNGNYNKQQLLNLIRDHINTVGRHYSGKISEWSVVNEAFTRNLHIFGLHDWWADHIGDMSYIDQAFIWARQADPNAKLILNDFNNEGENNVSDAMYAYIKSAKARGIPIDAIGMQMHIDGTHPPTKDEVVANMKRFGDLGIKVYVTEFDVNMHDVKASDTDKAQTEANIYYDMMRACIESKVCPSFSILGITDKETWYNYLNLPGAMPLPFDEHYKPKPAYYSLRNALEQP
jgi:endo-1,4-beta-xylanase